LQQKYTQLEQTASELRILVDHRRNEGQTETENKKSEVPKISEIYRAYQNLNQRNIQLEQTVSELRDLLDDDRKQVKAKNQTLAFRLTHHCERSMVVIKKIFSFRGLSDFDETRPKSGGWSRD